MKSAAVTTFHVVDTPARYVRDRIDPPESTTRQTTPPGSSDVVTPGRPIAPSPSPSRQQASTQSRPPSTVSTTPRPSHNETVATTRKPSVSPTPRPPSPQTAQFPTAKPVPGRPGFVYSIDPNGGIVDVTGYKPGDKAKDPYTKQIFIIP